MTRLKLKLIEQFDCPIDLDTMCYREVELHTTMLHVDGDTMYMTRYWKLATSTDSKESGIATPLLEVAKNLVRMK